jgi:hypothetical protein
MIGYQGWQHWKLPSALEYTCWLAPGVLFSVVSTAELVQGLKAACFSEYL